MMVHFIYHPDTVLNDCIFKISFYRSKSFTINIYVTIYFNISQLLGVPQECETQYILKLNIFFTHYNRDFWFQGNQDMAVRENILDLKYTYKIKTYTCLTKLIRGQSISFDFFRQFLVFCHVVIF